MRNDWEIYTGFVVTPIVDETTSRIELAVPELLPLSDGNFTADTEIFEFETVDAEGNQSTLRLQVSTTIHATFLGHTAHLTPPCVAKGERVQVHCFLPAQQYYWSPFGEDQYHWRRNEYVAMRTVSRRTVTPGAPNPSECYAVELDSRSSGHRKLRLATTKTGGEPVAYEIELLPDDGQLVLRDDRGNVVKVDSNADAVSLIAKGGASISCQGKTIVLNADRIVLGDSAEFAGSLSFFKPAQFDAHVTFAGGTTGDRT